MSKSINRILYRGNPFARPDGRIKRSAPEERSLNGLLFASKREMKRYQELLLLVRAGEIADIVLQPEYELQPAYIRNGRRCPAILYRADFRYWDIKKKRIVIEDVKGYSTDIFKLKMRMFYYRYPDLTVELI